MRRCTERGLLEPGQCSEPAVKGKAFCRYHMSLLAKRAVKAKRPVPRI